jgi:cytochrome c
MRVVCALLLLLAATAGNADDEVTQRGRTLAEALCAGCHAIGRDGDSPHAQAPAFHALDQRMDLDAFMDRLREGITTGHPDMPTFRFRREDARAFVRYIRSIQTP